MGCYLVSWAKTRGTYWGGGNDDNIIVLCQWNGTTLVLLLLYTARHGVGNLYAYLSSPSVSSLQLSSLTVLALFRARSNPLSSALVHGRLYSRSRWLVLLALAVVGIHLPSVVLPCRCSNSLWCLWWPGYLLRLSIIVICTRLCLLTLWDRVHYL
jgi:hypothetical protein